MQCGRHFKVPASAGNRLPVGVMHKSTSAPEAFKMPLNFSKHYLQVVVMLPGATSTWPQDWVCLEFPPPLPGPYTATIQSFAEHPHTFSPSQRWALTSFSSMQALVSLLTPTRSLL